MSTPLTIKAELRDRVGKGSSRAMRRDNRLPAVIYGEKQAPLAITLPYKELFMLIYAGGFRTKVLTIDLGKEKIQVLPKDYQLDPVKSMPLHIDLLRISAKSKVNVEIPVHFLNEEECVGLSQGGVLNVVSHTVEVHAPANAIPEYIAVDIKKYETGESIHISAAKLPQGVELVNHEEDFTLASISAPVAEEETDAEETEAAAAADDAEKAE